MTTMKQTGTAQVLEDGAAAQCRRRGPAAAGVRPENPRKCVESGVAGHCA